jgi:hypothetical protein
MISFYNYIKEDQDWSDYHSYYVATKDTDVSDVFNRRKINIKKGTVFNAAGGGIYKNSDGSIKTGIEDIEKSDFKKIPDPIWPSTISVTDKIEEFARNSIRMAKISPDKIESIIQKTIEVLSNIEDIIDDARENDLLYLKNDPYGEEIW